MQPKVFDNLKIIRIKIQSDITSLSLVITIFSIEKDACKYLRSTELASVDLRYAVWYSKELLE